MEFLKQFKKILQNKEGRQKFGVGMIVGLIMLVVLATVFLQVARTQIPTAATALHNLSDTLAADGDIIGTQPAALAGDVDTYFGWFLVVGFIVVALFIGLAIWGVSQNGRMR